MKKTHIPTIIIILAITSFVALIIHINPILSFIISGILVYIFYKRVDKSKQAKVYAQFLCLIFGLVIITTPLTNATRNDKEMRDNKEAIVSGTSDTYNYYSEPNTIERTVETKIIDIVGIDTQVTFLEISDTNLFIEYIARENLSSNLTKVGILTDITDLTESLSSVIPENIEQINFVPKLNLVDSYGNIALNKVGLITIKRVTWERINYNNFIYSDLEKIADTYWIHPSLEN